MVKISADNLLVIINDILDFSKIEAGHMELEEIEFDIRDELDACIKPIALKTQAKNIEVVLSIDPYVPTKWIGDPLRLKQIITNLVGNAVKFTDEGNVTYNSILKFQIPELVSRKIKLILSLTALRK